uniref:ADP-ribosylation factor-like 4aa n=2 Tax=Pseudocrenilabrinae TaxID=318546 RepID=A0A3Q4HCW7_NEOBR
MTVTFHFWDVGGQEKLRPLWKSYTRCTDGIIFVVDSVDAERMEEAKTELHKIAKSSENQGVPLLVVANKQDLRHSLGLAEIEKLGSKCATKTWPKLLYHPQQSKGLIQDWMDQCFYAVYTIF